MKNLEHKYSERGVRLLGVLIALMTILGTINALDINAYYHPEAFLFLIGGITSYVLIVNNTKPLANKVGDGAVYFGWLGLLSAWIYIAYAGFNEFNPRELGLSAAYSMHPLFYGYIIKLLSLASEI